MSVNTTYHPGGYNPTLSPGNGRAEEIDSTTGVVSRWHRDGSLIGSSPITPEQTSLMLSTDTTIASIKNSSTLEDRLRNLKADNDAYLLNATPTAGQIETQVRKLTRECNALIRLALRDLIATD